MPLWLAAFFWLEYSWFQDAASLTYTSYATTICAIIAIDHVIFYKKGKMEMSNFLTAVNYILENEGSDKFSDNPADKGGATRWGISLRFLKSLPKEKLKQYGLTCDEPDIDDVRNLSRDVAIEIYRGEFWQHANFDRIIDQDVGNYLFDMAVNAGISPSIKCAQRAIWSIYRSRKKCIEDGILGAETLRILNQYSADEILPVIRSERAGDYRTIVAHDATQKVFINGWLNRAYEK